MITKAHIIEVVGIYGIIMVLGAYFLNSFGFIASSDVWYQLMNLTGGAAFVYYTVKKQAWASLVVNVAWVLIAVTSLAKMFG